MYTKKSKKWSVKSQASVLVSAAVDARAAGESGSRRQQQQVIEIAPLPLPGALPLHFLGVVAYTYTHNPRGGRAAAPRSHCRAAARVTTHTSERESREESSANSEPRRRSSPPPPRVPPAATPCSAPVSSVLSSRAHDTHPASGGARALGAEHTAFALWW